MSSPWHSSSDSNAPEKANAAVELLPAETLCNILKLALEDIIEDDMMTTTEAKHRVIARGLQFPHTMASVCRYVWRLCQ